MSEINIDTIAKLGIDMCESRRLNNENLIMILSESEINLLTKSGVNFEIITDDVISEYQAKNKLYKQSNKLILNTNTDIPKNFTFGSMGGHFTFKETCDIFDDLNKEYPDLISKRLALTPTKTLEGRDLFYVKISNNRLSSKIKPAILFTALHHAREPQGLTQLVYFTRFLLESYSLDTNISKLMDNVDIYLVPCVNPDGYVYNETCYPEGGGMWRKNRAIVEGDTVGVDLNRNYGFNWGYDNVGSTSNPTGATFRGESAFSEFETQAIKNLCLNNNFKIAVNYHTFGDFMYYPWGFASDSLCLDKFRFYNFMENLSQKEVYLWGTSNQTIGYRYNGGSDDWIYGEQKLKNKTYSFTVEIGPMDEDFWTPEYSIISSAKSTLVKNLKCLKYLFDYATIKDKTPNVIQDKGYIKFDVTSIGLDSNRNFKISLIPASSNIVSVGDSKTYKSLTDLKSFNDSIYYELKKDVKSGDSIRFIIKIEGGINDEYVEINKLFGEPKKIFLDDFSNLANWDLQSSKWNLSSQEFTSPGYSLTDSPPGNYLPNKTNSLKLLKSIFVPDCKYAALKFKTKWNLQRNLDYFAFNVVGDDACLRTFPGKYSIINRNGPNELNYCYTGEQLNWVDEELDISQYKGQNISFVLSLTAYDEFCLDGVYIDNLTLQVLNCTSAVADNNLNNEFSVYPNPTSGLFFVNLANNYENSCWQVLNNLGEIALEGKILNEKTQLEINLNSMADGVYYLKIETQDKNTKAFKIVKL